MSQQQKFILSPCPRATNGTSNWELLVYSRSRLQLASQRSREQVPFVRPTRLHIPGCSDEFSPPVLVSFSFFNRLAAAEIYYLFAESLSSTFHWKSEHHLRIVMRFRSTGGQPMLTKHSIYRKFHKFTGRLISLLPLKTAQRYVSELLNWSGQ